jgi:hypothetical protein
VPPSGILLEIVAAQSQPSQRTRFLRIPKHKMTAHVNRTPCLLLLSSSGKQRQLYARAFKRTWRDSFSIGVRITMIQCIVYLLWIFKLFHGLMNNPVFSESMYSFPKLQRKLGKTYRITISVKVKDIRHVWIIPMNISKAYIVLSVEFCQLLDIYSSLNTMNSNFLYSNYAAPFLFKLVIVAVLWLYCKTDCIVAHAIHFVHFH